VLATFAYDDLGRRSGLTFGNGTSQAYTYDPVSRLKTLTSDLANTASDLTQTFGYTPASQVRSVIRTNDAYAWTGHGNGTTISAANGLNQVTSVGGATVTYDFKANLKFDPTRITGDYGGMVGRDYRSNMMPTNYLTVVFGPPQTERYLIFRCGQ
jgi:uncharacterized protein RhaS with RHS repeats